MCLVSGFAFAPLSAPNKLLKFEASPSGVNPSFTSWSDKKIRIKQANFHYFHLLPWKWNLWSRVQEQRYELLLPNYVRISLNPRKFPSKWAKQGQWSKKRGRGSKIELFGSKMKANKQVCVPTSNTRRQKVVDCSQPLHSKWSSKGTPWSKIVSCRFWRDPYETKV